MELYKYLVEELGYKMVECDVNFDSNNKPILTHDSIFNERYLYASLEELLTYAKAKDVWVMMDFLHVHLNWHRIKVISQLIRKYDMEDRVIIADAPIKKFSLQYPWFTYQIEGEWNVENIGRAIYYSKFGKTIILSQPNMDSAEINQNKLCYYKNIIAKAHAKGIVIKASVVNDVELANKLINIGTDLIMTDKIVNPKNSCKVFTVGVYDLLHVGHVNLFRRARSLGDTLLVAVQSSDYVERFKPQAKVLFGTEERMYMVRSIRYVDEVCEYQEVSEIITKVDFDVFVVGPDQTHAGFQKAIQWCEDHGKKVVVLPRTEGVSTSWLKEQIKSM